MNIGIEVKPPETECTDKNCPFHGSLKVRGQILEGRVVGDKTQSTVRVQREYYYYLKKYERYEKRKSTVFAHNPECLSVGEGDRVKIMECRPISKGKSFVVIEKVEG
jgi:small subunit ribosomal protein S17